MKISRLLPILIALIFSHTAAQEQKRPEWLDKPWELRYLLFVSDVDAFNTKLRSAQRANTNTIISGFEMLSLDASALFTPTDLIRVPRQKAIVTVAIRFDESGNLQASNLVSANWTAKEDELSEIMLVDKNTPEDRPYYLASWSQGTGDPRISPAVCKGFDDDRYQKGWDLSDIFGGFGCREWTAQLHDSKRPYIDVTSYSTDGSFIGEFVGWSRFADPKKPVIGKQGKTWLCLHECPAGEQPGVIKDIRKWTHKHGFPMPKRPPQQPLYPDPDFED